MNNSCPSSGGLSGHLVAKCLESVACERPIFHSEADFQHALAWHIQKTMPDCQVRLEFKPIQDKNLYLDIWLPNVEVAIELKYKTTALELEHDGEVFQLRDQAAHDCGRYDFLQDVSRLEKLVDDCSVQAKFGLAIFLTNDSRYWEYPRFLNDTHYRTPNDCYFRIHGGQTARGYLEWRKPHRDWEPTNRKEPIGLRGVYSLAWKEYSSFREDEATQFRYLLVQVFPRTELESARRLQKS